MQAAALVYTAVRKTIQMQLVSSDDSTTTPSFRDPLTTGWHRLVPFLGKAAAVFAKDSIIMSVSAVAKEYLGLMDIMAHAIDSSWCLAQACIKMGGGGYLQGIILHSKICLAGPQPASGVFTIIALLLYVLLS